MDAARDALLFGTSNAKLQQKILTENYDYDAAVKYGLSLEQSKKKIKSINETKATGERQEEDERISRMEKDLEKMKSKRKIKCKTCSRIHTGTCYATKSNNSCFDCGLTGHWKGAQVCKGNNKKDSSNTNGKEDNRYSKTGAKPKHPKKHKNRKVSEDTSSSEESDVDSI